MLLIIQQKQICNFSFFSAFGRILFMDKNLSLQEISPTLLSPYQNQSVAFQLILHEFLHIKNEILEIHYLSQKLKIKFSPSDTLEMMRHVTALSGPILEKTMPLPWDAQEGSLRKFQTHIKYFNLNFNERRGPLPAEYEIIDKMVSDCKNLLFITHDWKKQHISEPEKGEFETLLKLIKKNEERLKKLEKSTLDVLSKFKEDENVILFLMRNIKQFEQMFGMTFLESELQNFFPEGTEEIENFLIKAFSKRGFFTLKKMILKQCSLLTKESTK